MPSSYSGGEQNPFATPPGEKDPVRRLRGRLAAPVTIITAGEEDERVGLTVSSLVIAEGEPGLVYFLINATTDLFYAITETRKFIIHVCEGRHRELADVFAALRPSPGGMFIEQPVTQTEYGPVLDSIGTRVYCSYRGQVEESYSVAVSAAIDRVEIADIDDPLVYFRGRYRALD